MTEWKQITNDEFRKLCSEQVREAVAGYTMPGGHGQHAEIETAWRFEDGTVIRERQKHGKWTFERKVEGG